MATQKVLMGDTITVKVSFFDASLTPIDTDTNSAVFTAYDENEKVVTTTNATRISVGVYSHDWLVPNIQDAIYFLEMKGFFSTEPQLKRMKVKTKFNIS